MAVSVCPQGSIEERLKQLQDAHRDFGPGSQHFLSSKNYFLLFDVGASCRTNLCHAVPRHHLRVWRDEKRVRCIIVLL